MQNLGDFRSTGSWRRLQRLRAQDLERNHFESTGLRFYESLGIEDVRLGF